MEVLGASDQPNFSGTTLELVLPKLGSESAVQKHCPPGQMEGGAHTSRRVGPTRGRKRPREDRAVDNVHDCLLSGLLEIEKVGSHLERLCLLFSPHLTRPAVVSGKELHMQPMLYDLKCFTELLEAPLFTSVSGVCRSDFNFSESL